MHAHDCNILLLSKTRILIIVDHIKPIYIFPITNGSEVGPAFIKSFNVLTKQGLCAREW